MQADGSLVVLAIAAAVFAISLVASLAPDSWPVSWPMFATVRVAYFWDANDRPLSHLALGGVPDDTGGVELAAFLRRYEEGSMPPTSGMFISADRIIRIDVGSNGELHGESMTIRGLDLPRVVLQKLGAHHDV